MTIIFMAFLFISACSGLGYGIYQNGNAQLKADDRYHQKVQSLEAQRGLLEARSMESEQELKRARSRITLLNRELMSLRPAGALMRRNTRVLRQQSKAHETDPDTLALSSYHLYTLADGDGDLPPMQLL